MASAAAKKSQELAPVEQGGVPALYDYGGDSGAGFDTASKDDFLIPLMSILQAKSPEVENDVPGAKAGGLIVRATGEIYDGRRGVPMILCATQRVFVQWGARSAGGGIKGTHTPESDFVRAVHDANGDKKYGKLKVDGSEWSDKNPADDLIETFYEWNLMIDPETGATQGIIIPMTSSQINVHKGVMTKLRSILVPNGKGGRVNPPLFAHRMLYKTVKVSKNNNTWDNFVVGYDGANAQEARLDPRGDQYQAAKGFYDLYKEGALTVNTAGAASDEGSSGEGGASRGGFRGDADRDDTEIPF